MDITAPLTSALKHLLLVFFQSLASETEWKSSPDRQDGENGLVGGLGSALLPENFSLHFCHVATCLDEGKIITNLRTVT